MNVPKVGDPMKIEEYTPKEDPEEFNPIAPCLNGNIQP